jgi:hypothetical protein
MTYPEYHRIPKALGPPGHGRLTGQRMSTAARRQHRVRASAHDLTMLSFLALIDFWFCALTREPHQLEPVRVVSRVQNGVIQRLP